MKSFLTTAHPEALDLVEAFINETIHEVGSESYFTSVDPVSSESYSGFIAFTDGGWDGVATFGFYGEEAYAQPTMRKFLDDDYESMCEAFRTENELAEDADLDVMEGWDDFRSDWEQSDESYWFMKVRALCYSAESPRNSSGEDEVFLMAGINLDFNYGRDSISWCPGVGSEWKWERTIPLSQITPELLAECQAEILKVL